MAPDQQWSKHMIKEFSGKPYKFALNTFGKVVIPGMKENRKPEAIEAVPGPYPLPAPEKKKPESPGDEAGSDPLSSPRSSQHAASSSRSSLRSYFPSDADSGEAADAEALVASWSIANVLPPKQLNLHEPRQTSMASPGADGRRGFKDLEQSSLDKYPRPQDNNPAIDGLRWDRSASGTVEELALAKVMDNEETPMAEMFTLFPHESAVVMQRGIELGIICSCLLVFHCWQLVLRFWSAEESADVILRTLCIARILCAIPRPYFWIRTRRLFVQARYQPTPQLVTRRLLDIYSNPFGIEKALLLVYYGWLAAVSLVVCVFRLYPEQSAFTHEIWRHCLFNFISIAVHRILCVLLFYYLMKSDFKRGIPHEMLEKYSKRLMFRSALAGHQLGSKDDWECSICFGAYSDGQEIRKLGCHHHFHQDVTQADHP
ncbi:hypothetical protein AK812_SmicGene11689 [Symbiodinium microadriaticum]|uniref:RING-type domain-containing protein n=1 Tax=Symbiodinium microadriaticum TaxID=2951 RepID=A0A1Q9ECN9_SYMMI|nr:hypothetical protein AK812_SmicGene11689 [Symbiodinium microadriaticum]